MGVAVVSLEEHEKLRQEFEAFAEFMTDYMESVDDEIKGYEAAAKFVGVSRSTMVRLVEAGRIPLKADGKVKSFSRKDLVHYKRTRRLGGKPSPFTPLYTTEHKGKHETRNNIRNRNN